MASAAARTADLEDRLKALLTQPPHPLAGRGTRATLVALAAIVLLAFPVSCRREPLDELSADLLILEGAPGDPLVKYVGLPVKVLPEATFRAQLDASRQAAAQRTRPLVPGAQRRQAEAEAAVAAAREEVDRTRAAWLDSPEASRQRIRAEQAYVSAMHRKDDTVRRAADAVFETLGAVHAADARFAEIEFEELSGAVPEGSASWRAAACWGCRSGRGRRSRRPSGRRCARGPRAVVRERDLAGPHSSFMHLDAD